MKVGKIIKIGDSLAVVIPKSHLKTLGWRRGDYVLQAIEDDQLIFRNMRSPLINPLHRVKTDDTSNTSRAERAV